MNDDMDYDLLELLAGSDDSATGSSGNHRFPHGPVPTRRYAVHEHASDLVRRLHCDSDTVSELSFDDNQSGGE
jgi:hypothetical protein